MHYLYYVAVEKQKKTAQEAQRIAQQMLDSNGFAGDGGFWSGSKSDWFVIGGRWSGHLQGIQLKEWHKKATALVMQGKKDNTHTFITTEDIKNNNKELQKLWVKLGGKGKHSWDRDTYDHAGTKDDSMLLTKKLYTALREEAELKKSKDHPFRGSIEVAVVSDNDYIEEEVLMKNFLKEKNIIGKYYIVVVDYHI